MRKRDPDGVSGVVRRSIGQVVDVLTRRKERLASRKKAVRLRERTHPPSTGLTRSEGLMWGPESTGYTYTRGLWLCKLFQPSKFNGC